MLADAVNPIARTQFDIAAERSSSGAVIAPALPVTLMRHRLAEKGLGVQEKTNPLRRRPRMACTLRLVDRSPRSAHSCRVTEIRVGTRWLHNNSLRESFDPRIRERDLRTIRSDQAIGIVADQFVADMEFTPRRSPSRHRRDVRFGRCPIARGWRTTAPRRSRWPDRSSQRSARSPSCAGTRWNGIELPICLPRGPPEIAGIVLGERRFLAHSDSPWRKAVTSIVKECSPAMVPASDRSISGPLPRSRPPRNEGGDGLHSPAEARAPGGDTSTLCKKLVSPHAAALRLGANGTVMLRSKAFGRGKWAEDPA